MIWIERDPRFWCGVAQHPEVEPHVLFGRPVGGLVDLVKSPRTVPLASYHGGFLFLQLDQLGRAFELHTMFIPDGWGREVAAAARSAFTAMFERGAQVILTLEAQDWWRSAPPRSHGWRAVGGFEPAGDLPPLRSWLLTADAWAASPVGRKASKCP